MGTSGCRAVLFGEDFSVREKAASSYPLLVRQPQWAEQEAGRVLSVTLRTIRQCLGKAAIPPHEVLAIGLSGVLYTVLAVDGQGRPLLPVIQWCDNRAGAQADRIEKAHREANLYQRTGCRNNSMYLPAKILWIKEELPLLFEKTYKFLSLKDYVAHYLAGGPYRTDFILASASGLFNIHELKWDPEACKIAGLAEGRLPEAVPPQALLGGIRREAAKAIGLLEGTPLFAGGGDGPLSNVGAGVIAPGQLNLSIGSGGILRMILDRPRLCPAQRTWCYVLKEDLWVLGGVNNGGMVLQWFWDSFWGRGLKGGRTRADRFRLLDQWAASVPAGAEGLIFLPYLTGERSPNWRREARASFVGIGSHHHRGHFARAVMEGLGFQMRRVFEAMEEIGGRAEEIRFTGGFVRSCLWRQIMCDILGREVMLPQATETSALGAAVMAGLGLGMISDLMAARERIQVAAVLRPREETGCQYRALYSLFRDLYQDAVRGWESLQQLALQGHTTEAKQGGAR